MLKQKNFPRILFYNGVTHSEYSLELLSFGRDTKVVPLDPATGTLYFGLYKPFAALFAELSVASAVSTSFTIEYWNGSTWNIVSGLVDDTKAFTRSGFIQFDRPDDWASTAVNSIDAYWIRIVPVLAITNTTALQGLGIVFSDDQDLNGVYPGVSAYLVGSETSFILRHENSRDLIVQEIRNHMRKSPVGSGRWESIDAWDFLRIDEVRMWSVHLTLANIFSSLQSNGSDLYKEKATEFRELAERYKNEFFLTIDRDDDGKVDAGESVSSIKTITLVRG